MTLRDLFNAVRGYDHRQQLMYRATWEQARWLGAVMMNANGFSKKRFKPTDLTKFPWDDKEVDRSKEIELIKERRKWLEQ